MKVTLNRVNNKMHFEGKGKSEVPINIDPDGEGASPMELLLMAVGGCSAVDIVSILEKQRQKVTSYKMEVEGDRREFRQAKPFQAIHVTIILEGKIDQAKAIRAAQLSFEKYCSVSLTMKGSVQVDYSIILNNQPIEIE